MHQHKKILVFDKLWKRLRYKQSTELKYHSIPKSDLSSKKSSKYSRLIKLSNHNLRYISYSIPLLCIMLLLALGVISFNPAVNERTFALGNDQDEARADLPSEAAAEAEAESLSEENSTDEENSLDVNTAEDHDDLIAPQSVDSAINLTITNQNMAATQVPTSGIAYRSHQVSVNATDISSYSLTISYAEEDGAMRLEQDQNTTLKDATGTDMASMSEDSWGWAWSDSLDSDEAGLRYYAMPQLSTHASSLKTGLLENASATNYNASFTKRLVFGVKFSKKALAGAYHTSAILSLAAAPKLTMGYWHLPDGMEKPSNILTMQGMSADICNQVETPDEGATTIPMLTLRDTRGGGYTNDENENSYIIGKLSDGNCWMLQNLSLTVEDLKAATNSTYLTSANSDVMSSFNLSGSTVASLTSSNFSEANVAKAEIHNPSSNYLGRAKGYGAYYNWYAATAGTGNSSLASGKASASICPKGWKLPAANITDTSNQEYKYSFEWLVTDPTTGDPIAQDKPWSVYTNAELGLNGIGGAIFRSGFFPVAGRIAGGSWEYAHGSMNRAVVVTNSINSTGRYWSSATNAAGTAYSLDFQSDGFRITKYNRYEGFSVRCVAPAS